MAVAAPRRSSQNRELFSCPIRVGTWVAAILTYGLHLLAGPTRVLLTILSAAGAAELLGATTEALSWSGAVARHRIGTGEPTR